MLRAFLVVILGRVSITHLLHSARSIDEIKHVPQCRKSTPRRPRIGRAGAHDCVICVETRCAVSRPNLILNDIAKTADMHTPTAV